MTQYASVTAIEFPDAFRLFLSTIDVINLDVGWLLTAVCIVKVGFMCCSCGRSLFLRVRLRARVTNRLVVKHVERSEEASHLQVQHSLCYRRDCRQPNLIPFHVTLACSVVSH